MMQLKLSVDAMTAVDSKKNPAVPLKNSRQILP